MRRRIVASTLAIAMVVATVFGLPLAFFGARFLEDAAQERVQLEAERVARAVELRRAIDLPITADALDAAASGIREVVVDLRTGLRLHTGPEVRAPGAVRATVTSRDGDTVTVAEPRDRLHGDVRRLRVLVLVVGLVAVAAAAAVTWVQSRRLSEPLVDLAHTAERLGSGNPRPHQRRYGIGELDRVAVSLDASAERIARTLAAERQFATNASHQLRTPLTALSMRLEEILAANDRRTVREEAAAALAQVERLTDVVDTLLAAARSRRTASAVPVDVDAVVDAQRTEWRPQFDAAGRSVVVAGQRGVRALATPGGLSQVLATLLENALAHGAGTVTVSVRDDGVSVIIEVSDEGPGVPPEIASRIFERQVSGGSGTGLGLSVARDIAEADGGRLELVRRTPAAFALFLAAAPGPAGGNRRRRPRGQPRDSLPAATETRSSRSTAGNTQRR